MSMAKPIVLRVLWLDYIAQFNLTNALQATIDHSNALRLDYQDTL
ncbi:MAG: hypothetical protein VX112_03940 [Pseudomonadota bacterium]|nr:hypothetical protein [Pseudomonadota bacterium]